MVEKCTLCTERLRNGDVPRCVEACNERGTRAIVFGDLNDPASEVRQVIRSGDAARRKAELGTNPQVYYSL